MSSWLPEAVPQSVAELEGEAPDAEVVQAARVRGITRIVHFTRTTGYTGILADGTVRARRDLPAVERLRHIYEDNSPDRSRDAPWHGYVNLSISEINRDFFTHSMRWHPGLEWVVLEFDVEILSHVGVVFVTTNNAYPVARRARGRLGFEQMFAPRVPWGMYGSVRDRSGRAAHQTTCPQAEVLYPGALALQYLVNVTVGDEATLETVEAIQTHFPRKPPILLKPEAFQ